jgi:hypothetical protein
MILRAINLFLLLAFSAGAQIITNSINPTNLPPTLSYVGLAGVQGGIDQYSTNYTMYENVKTAGAYGDGFHDDTAVLQAAVANCPNGEYVYIPTGTYLINGTLNHTGVNKYDGHQYPYNIVIRGDGPTNTIILENGGGEIISFLGASGSMGLNLGSINSGNTRGSTTINFNVPTFLDVGQWIWIQHQTNADGSFYPSSGDANPFFYNYNPSSSQIVKVTGISGTGSGQNVTFWPPLNEGFTGDTVQIASSPPLHCGIENLCVTRLNYVANDNIDISCGEECWIRNVESRQARSGHIYLHFCGGCEVDNCFVHDPFPYEDGATGGGNSVYGITLGYYSSSCLVQNNIALHCRHSFIMETGGGQDNVIAYNYGSQNINQNFFTTDYQMDTDYHGGEQRFCLWEGNVVPILRADGIEGATKHNTYFRNFVTRDGISAVNIVVNAIDFQRGNYFDSFIENVYAPTNSVNSAGAFNNPVNYASSAGGYRIGSIQDTYPYDPNVFTNNTWLGNYDMSAGLVDGSTNGVIYWTSSVPATFPSSLFYTNKPSWFGTNVWPPFGKDVAGYTNPIPAQVTAQGIAEFGTTLSDGHTLTTVAANGTVSIPGNGSYFNTACVALTATPNAGYAFSGWSGYPVANPNSPNTYLVMPSANASVTANFVQGTSYTLNVVNGTGSGSYMPGTTVTIAASALSGQQFTSWMVPSVNIASTNTMTTTITMPSGNVTATANFVPVASGSSPVTTTNTPVTSGSGPVTTSNGLVAWYAFDDGNGSAAADSSGNGIAGTLANNPAWGSGVIGSGALSFNGSSQYVSIPNQSGTTLAGVNAATVSAWVKTTTGGTIICSGGACINWGNYTLSVAGGSAVAEFVNANVSSGQFSVSSSSTVNDGKWHLITGVLNGTSITLYVDGAISGARSDFSGNIFNDSGRSVIDIGATPATGECGSPAIGYFNGSIDDVRIYNRPLSSSEIQNLYLAKAATASPVPTPPGKLFILH